MMTPEVEKPIEEVFLHEWENCIELPIEPQRTFETTVGRTTPIPAQSALRYAEHLFDPLVLPPSVPFCIRCVVALLARCFTFLASLFHSVKLV